MNLNTFRICLISLAAGFTLAFVAICIPPFLEDPDIVGAFAGGFVNPYATGYALDIFFTWGVLATWVLYEARAKGIRHGWVALLVGVVPGVAVGFAAYLLIRLKQEKSADDSFLVAMNPDRTASGHSD
jgi:Terpene cyclase DEP1